MRLPNSIFAQTAGVLPRKGLFQKPDFAWHIPHAYQGSAWSVSPTEMVWCEVVGEGKPTHLPNIGANDHSLNQVVMAASACIYYQIALGKQDPEVLAFTLNEEKVRFFWVMGQEDVGENRAARWTINYCHIRNQDLDLSILGDVIKIHTLTKVLRDKIQESLLELNDLWVRKMAQGSEVVQWWISNEDDHESMQSVSEILDDNGGGGSGVQEAEYESGVGETGRSPDVNVGGSHHGPWTITGGRGGGENEDSGGAGRDAGRGWLSNKGSRTSGHWSRRDKGRRRGIGWLSLALSSPFRKMGIIN
jgi:hypothetical protein